MADLQAEEFPSARQLPKEDLSKGSRPPRPIPQRISIGGQSRLEPQPKFRFTNRIRASALRPIKGMGPASSDVAAKPVPPGPSKLNAT